MKASVIAVGLIAAAIAISLIVVYTPPPDDFSLENPGWNGLSKLSSELRLRRVNSIPDERLLLDPSNATLLLIGPEAEFTQRETEFLTEFMNRGGIVILMDDFGSGNTLLQLLEVAPRFNGSLLLDPLFKERSSALPKIRAPAMNLSEIVLNYATVIEECGKPLAYSSFYSFLDVDSDGVWDAGEPEGPLVVACAVEMGKGELILVADSSVGINSMLDLGSNAIFLKKLIGDREVFIDESHWKPSRFAVAREWLLTAASLIAQPEVRYAVVAAAVVAVMRYRRGAGRGESEVEKVLMRNPTWDKALLEKLQREMRGER